MLRNRLLPILALAAAASPAAACDSGPMQIFYAPGSTRLSDNDRSLLHYMESLAGDVSFIRLTGHTDTAGHAEANLRLSRRRVEEARAHLVALGMRPGRILTQSFGENRSITALDDGQADPRHRYVLVELVSPVEARKGAAGRARRSCGG